MQTALHLMAMEIAKMQELEALFRLRLKHLEDALGIEAPNEPKREPN